MEANMEAMLIIGVSGMIAVVVVGALFMWLMPNKEEEDMKASDVFVTAMGSDNAVEAIDDMWDVIKVTTFALTVSAAVLFFVWAVVQAYV
jgi:quercetin dioxygenase-like cupin family protein